MNLSIVSKAPKSDVLVLSLFEKEKPSSSITKHLPKEAVNALEKRLKAGDFEGNSGEVLKLFLDTGNVKKIVVLGKGKKDKIGPHSIEHLGGNSAKLLASVKAKSATFLLEKEEMEEFINGLVLGTYQFSEYKKKDPKKVDFENAYFLCEPNKSNKTILEKAKLFEELSIYTRTLVNTPASDMNTLTLAEEAKSVAKKYKMKIKIFDEKELKKMGCGALLGVGKGAEFQPRLVIIEHKHRSSSKVPNIAFVGKGIIFDTGGLNLKPTGYIETMKQDMAGAGTVLAVMKGIAEAKISGHFLGVMALAENAISDRATHPGDVLKAYNGKTIEVNNTDAEGRLVLADALSYVEKNYKPHAILDIATLTGAVSVALGYHITGLMGNNKKLMAEVKEAAAASHERVWELPLDEDFVEATKGTFTDLKNSTDGVRAGTIMGAAFLKQFVEKTPWVHFDIGGTAWAEKPEPTTQYGSTAVMIRTFLEMAKRHGS